MHIPVYLSEIIHNLNEEVLLHPTHALLPVYRQHIYGYLRGHGRQGERVRAVLALQTAKHSFFLWEEAYSNDTYIRSVLVTAEDLLLGTVSLEKAKEKAGEAWEEVERLGMHSVTEVAEHPWYAAEAVVIALQEVIGSNPLGAALIDSTVTDDDLDPWESDAAKWAAAAYAGRVTSACSNNSKRRDFWYWWLNTAIRDAWTQVALEDYVP